MKKVFLSYAIAPMLLIGVVLLSAGKPAIKNVTYPLLESNCYETEQAATDAYSNRLIDVKHCHIVDEESSGVTVHIVSVTPAGHWILEYCYNIYGL